MKIKQKRDKGKAIFEIILMIISVFSFSWIIDEQTQNQIIISAEEISGAGCCTETKSGAICQNLLFNQQNECKNPIQNTICEQFSDCQPGCCYSSEIGSCSLNAPKKECESNGGLWFNDNNCNIQQCSKGCCILGEETKFITQGECKYNSESLGLNFNFQSDIRDEISCWALSKTETKGACVYDNPIGPDSCRYQTESECISGRGNFFKNSLCSNPALNTSCKPSKETTCVKGKDGVYFLDSCGNVANIYDSSKLNDINYWTTPIDSSGSCGSGSSNGNSKSCGNCNFVLGSRCEEYNSETGKPNYGEYICKDLSCEWNGQKKLNGESWCDFDANVGKGKDRVGSQHYKYVCADGEVRVEPCADYRQELCSETTQTRDTGEEFSTAICRPNLWRDCIFGNGCDEDNSDCKTSPEFDLQKEPLEGLRGLSNKDRSEPLPAVCLPNYPPGFDLGFTENEEGELSMAGYDAAQSICELGYNKCVSTWVKEKKKDWGWGSYDYRERCFDNCKCDPESQGEDLSAEVKEVMDARCYSLGDCSGSRLYIEVDYVEGQIVPIPNKLISESKKALESKEDDNRNLTWGLENVDINKPNILEGAKDIAMYSGIAGGISGVALWLNPMGLFSAAKIVTTTMETFSGLGLPPPPPTMTSAPVQIPPGSLAGFAGAAIGAGIGAFLGTQIAKISGVTEKSHATAITIMAGALGAYVGAGITMKGGIGAALGPKGFVNPYVVIGALIIIAIFTLLPGKWQVYDTYQKEFEYHCLPWSPPDGGELCGKCNENPLKPCSKYKCQSLGTACELINEGSENPLCVASGEDDGSAPNIMPWEEGFSSDVKITSLSSSGYSVRDSSGNCVPGFTKFKIGIKTDEPSQCKIDTFHTDSFEEMSKYFGSSSAYTYNHEMELMLPDPKSVGTKLPESSGENDEGEKIFNGQVNYFIRCKDRYGNENSKEYNIDVCVREGQDNSIPIIEKTEPATGSFIKYGLNSSKLSVYTNEPSECKWSLEDKTYEDMENNLSCYTEAAQYTDNGWMCIGDLENLQLINNYYIRCSDQPWLGESYERNTMQESHILNLRKSESELNISAMMIETNANLFGKTITYGSEPVSVDLTVRTTGGADGKATCSYKFGEDSEELTNIGYSLFYSTNTKDHFQKFTSIMKGEQIINVYCEDNSGNKAKSKIEFEVKIDDVSPKIVRSYNEGSSLKIITDEDSICSYSNNAKIRCNFDVESENVTQMIGAGQTHIGNWELGKTYYIKCQDIYGNSNGGCGIIVKTY